MDDDRKKKPFNPGRTVMRPKQPQWFGRVWYKYLTEEFATDYHFMHLIGFMIMAATVVMVLSDRELPNQWWMLVSGVMSYYFIRSDKSNSSVSDKKNDDEDQDPPIFPS